MVGDFNIFASISQMVEVIKDKEGASKCHNQTLTK